MASLVLKLLELWVALHSSWPSFNKLPDLWVLPTKSQLWPHRRWMHCFSRSKPKVTIRYLSATNSWSNEYKCHSAGPRNMTDNADITHEHLHRATYANNHSPHIYTSYQWVLQETNWNTNCMSSFQTKTQTSKVSKTDWKCFYFQRTGEKRKYAVFCIDIIGIKTFKTGIVIFFLFSFSFFKKTNNKNKEAKNHNKNKVQYYSILEREGVKGVMVILLTKSKHFTDHSSIVIIKSIITDSSPRSVDLNLYSASWWIWGSIHQTYIHWNIYIYIYTHTQSDIYITKYCSQDNFNCFYCNVPYAQILLAGNSRDMHLLVTMTYDLRDIYARDWPARRYDLAGDCDSPDTLSLAHW